MAAIPLINIDPTIQAMKVALEEVAAADKPRPYLGMSSIGDECSRKLWYQWRWFDANVFDADTLARFADGHASEDITADRLRKVPGINLVTHLSTGKQIGYSDIGGHFKGHLDGQIEGLLQAPKTKHVWEHKCVNEAKFKKLEKLKEELGEKQALAKWDEIYYAQAVLYMFYADLTRHYLTVTTPGSREITSCRTEANNDYARELIAKAESIICSEEPPQKLSQDPSFYKCKWCNFSDVCHYQAPILQHCRTCAFSQPIEGGKWECKAWGEIPYEGQLQGCDQWTSLV